MPVHAVEVAEDERRGDPVACRPCLHLRTAASDGLGDVDRSIGFTDGRPCSTASPSADRRILQT
jgi:hypothetical protein